MHIKKIRHSKLPITLESSDPLTHDMLYTIQLNMMYDENEKRDENQSGWLLWVDEYGNWFNPFKPNPNQLTLFDMELFEKKP
tara:strand:- start:111 stop:356 length:246 start_codon:yes stop_codon:yes gene_type:complete